MMKQLVGTFTASVLLAAAASAQTRAGGEFRVSTNTASLPLYTSIARHENGSFVVVWDDLNDFSVKGQRFGRAGNRLGAEFSVNTAGYCRYSAVAMDPKGDFIVVWTNYPDGSDRGIRGRRFDANANPLGSEFQVNTYTTGDQKAPNLAIDGLGNFVVAWWSYLQDGSSFSIDAQRFDAQGNRRGGEFQVNTYTTGNQSLADISTDAAGNFVIAWTSLPGTNGSVRSVNAQRYDANGVPLGASFLVNTYTTGGQLGGGGLAHAPDGTFVIAWFDQEFDNSTGVVARRYDTAGNGIGSEFQVNSTTTDLQRYPDVGMDAQGNFVVSWWDQVNDGSSLGVFARRFRADGTPRGADFLVNTYTTGPQHPNRFASAIASDEVGNFIITWGGSAPSGALDAFGQRYGGLHPDSMVVDTTGNSVLEPGETVELRPGWVNANGVAQTFRGTLTAISGPAGATYTITDGGGDYGTVANDTTAPCTDCYEVRVSNPNPRPALHWDASVVESILPDTQGQQKQWLLHVGRSFTDVPTAGPFYPFIETLLHKGVTGGCGGTNYCPSTATTRDQMSVFVLLAKEGPGHRPPACGTPVFNDVPASNPFCKYIEELARRGVVSGCGGNNYCPTVAVTREQMSVFALRTLDPNLNPPACGTPMFGDVPASSPFCRWIEELVRRGVVTGCGSGNYCPTLAVTREQMGVFISATFGLALYGP